MATISNLLQTLSLMALFLMHSKDVTSFPSPPASTSFSYDTFSQNTLNLTYQGGTHSPQGATFLRLTKTVSSGLPLRENAGRVLYSHPILFHILLRTARPPIHATFETTIKFRITPSRNGAGDGLAFFIAPVNTTIPNGATGGNLGIFGSDGTTPCLFAVEFNNLVNGWGPNYRHIGIDIESRASRNTARFDSATGELVTARITYDPRTRTISVVATSGSQTASLSYVFDLRTILPEQVQVGISAATGRTAALHDIISWNFTSDVQPLSDNNDEEVYIRKYMGKY